jgi:DnaJ-domain-containing protein 1
VDRDRLVLGLAAVFTGLTVLLVVLSFVYSLFLLVAAVPFGGTAYFMWYHASGRMEERTRARAARDPRDFRTDAASGSPGGFSARARDARARANAGAGPGPGPGAGAGARGDRAPSSRPGPTPAEAYRALDLSPGADADEVRRAYREKVKEVHPDTDSGSEEAFKRVNRAYETLTE